MYEKPRIPDRCVECGITLPRSYDYTEEIEEESDTHRYLVAIAVINCPECGAKHEEELGVSRR